jgi:feruloyl esterase
LTDTQVDALKKVYAGPTTTAGVKLSPGGAVSGWEQDWILEPGVDGMGYIVSDGSESALEKSATEYFRWTVLPPNGSGWHLEDFDFDRDSRRFANGTQESLLEDTNPDLRRFKAAGGKLILYLGWKEWSLPRQAIDYYETVERTMGGRSATRSFFRLFLVPGMNHCAGGEGASAIDVLHYMETWVERGQPPDVMIGAHVRTENPMTLKFPLEPGTQMTFTRPIYPYPLWAKYKGSGDTSRAENFRPVSP